MYNVKLSVVVPVYNTKDYLARCLDSILNQSYTSIEIILVDDASEEDIQSIIDEYRDHENLKYHRLPSNIGLGAARNYGISKALGDYITFCDSDDWVDLMLYESMINSLERNNADIAICGTLKGFPSGEAPTVKASFEKELVLKGSTAFKIMTFQYEYGITITPSATNKVVRTSFIKQHNISFPEGYYFEDLPYSFFLLLNAKNVVCIPKYYLHYFRRDGSIIISISKHHIDSFSLAFETIKDYLIQNRLFDEYKFNYFKFGERFYNLIIRQIFEFELDISKKKEMLEYSLNVVKRLITMKEFIEYNSVEKLRKHLQPYVKSTEII